MSITCYRTCLVFVFRIFFVPLVAFAQPVINPVDFSLKLSGTFGEPRQNHFHSGVDIKTFGREGYSVCAVHDGYISRVKNSSGGFGVVLYVDHDSDYTSVYAHLHHLEGPIARFVDSIRIAERKNEIELYPDSGMFNVRAGELIGISGNSGSSEGPHLHFEWRRKGSQMPLNPLRTSLYELLSDTVHPVIRSVKLYALNNNRWLPVMGKESVWVKSAFQDTIYVDHDTLGIALNCFDPDSNNLNGVHRLLLKSDADTLWYFQLDSFSFDNTRYVNAHVDYNHWLYNKGQYRRMFRLAGDTVTPGSGTGKIALNRAGQVRQFTALVSDFSGNMDSIVFSLLRSERREATGHSPGHNLTGWDTLSGKVRITIPPGALYQSAQIELSIRDSLAGLINASSIRLISDDLCPLHKQGTIIWNDTSLWVHYSSRLFLGRFDERKRLQETLPVKRVKEGLSTSFRNWGNYFLIIDSIPPRITEAGVYLDSVDMKLYRFFELEEKESGLKDYMMEVNGKWQLCKYEVRKRRLSVPIDHNITGPLFYRVEITDAAGNSEIALYLF